METNPQTWRPPVAPFDIPRRTPRRVIAIRVLGTLFSGPAVLLAGIVTAVSGPFALCFAIAAATGIGIGLGQTYEPRTRVGASIAHAFFALVMAAGLLVVFLIIAFSNLHGEVL